MAFLEKLIENPKSINESWWLRRAADAGEAQGPGAEPREKTCMVHVLIFPIRRVIRLEEYTRTH